MCSRTLSIFVILKSEDVNERNGKSEGNVFLMPFSSLNHTIYRWPRGRGGVWNSPDAEMGLYQRFQRPGVHFRIPQMMCLKQKQSPWKAFENRCRPTRAGHYQVWEPRWLSLVGWQSLLRLHGNNRQPLVASSLHGSQLTKTLFLRNANPICFFFFTTRAASGESIMWQI